MPDSQLFLIDAHALCYRSYFAIRNLSTSYGQATNAVYGFFSTLRKIFRDYKPEYAAICFDSAKKTYRQEKFAEYKIHRPSMPDDLVSQIPLIKETVLAYSLSIFEIEGFEADDIIATLASKVAGKDMDVVIVSDDKDMIQLLDGRVKIFSARDSKILSYHEIKQRFGIEPQKIIDYIGLAGDKTDNIPGVIGIGDVTARNLINQFGTLENIYKNLDALSSEKVRDKLREQKDNAVFSKELALLDRNVPMKFDFNTLKVGQPDHKRLAALFRQLEFRRLTEEFSQEEDQKPLEVHPVENAKDREALFAHIRKKGRFAFIPGPVDDDTGSCQKILVAVDDTQVYEVPKGQWGHLNDILEDDSVLKVTYDVKTALKLLDPECHLRADIFDVMIAAYLLAPSSGAYDVGALSWKYFKKTVEIKGNAANEVSAVLAVYEPLKKELEEKSLLKLFEEIEIPLISVLFKMEKEGVNLDLAFLKEMSRDCDKRIKTLLKEIYVLAGEEFNLNSPKQLSQVLFGKLKLPVMKKTKTGFSTDEGVLTKLAKKHEIIEQILEYRQLAKLKSTYIDALPKLVSPKTGRLHASFNQAGAETGRLSSNNPNLQNIPIRTNLGQKIRKAFVPYAKDHWIVSADYSQIELRILAHLSKDKNLHQAFQKDEDIHNFTAALIFDVKEKNVTASMRNTAKRVNFGIIYGMSAFGLAKDLNISQGEAQEFIDKYFLRYPNVKKFMKSQIKMAEDTGYVLTILNRRRYVPEINSDNISVRQFAQRQAINTPVQGSAADLIKLAMIQIQRELEKKKFESRMMITVHDELVFDVLDKEKEDVVKLVRETMEHALTLSVPVRVSVKIGKNWLETKEI